MGTIESWKRRHRNPGAVAHYVVVGTEGRERFFVPGPLARLVFGTLRDRHDTVAVCLMPDRLLWLLRSRAGVRGVRRTVRELKSVTTRLARHEGVTGRLWEKGERVRSVEEAAERERLASRLRELPVTSGLVAGEDDWPYLAVSERRARSGTGP